jgi:hypothetical protein
VLKFGKVTDTLSIYLLNLLAYRDFWSEVSVTSRNKRKIDHYQEARRQCGFRCDDLAFAFRLLDAGYLIRIIVMN